VTSLTVRRAEVGDAELVSRLNGDVHAVHAEGLPFRFKPPSAETFPASSVAELLGRAETLMFIGCVDDVPAGYLYGEIRRLPENAVRYAVATVYVHHISVRPDCRGRGLGTALLDAVRAAALGLGISRVGLDVWTFNERALGFFRRQGFGTIRATLQQQLASGEVGSVTDDFPC
jgi:ribosomal protein S18 acetylase RimI-like enzyme